MRLWVWVRNEIEGWTRVGARSEATSASPSIDAVTINRLLLVRGAKRRAKKVQNLQRSDERFFGLNAVIMNQLLLCDSLRSSI